MIYQKYHSVIKDFFYLVTNRGLDSLIGIVVIPYLISIIGSGLYGQIAVAQSIVLLGVTFINYGLDIYLLKQVPIYINEKKINNISILISAIIYARLGLFILLFVVYIILSSILNITGEVNNYVYIFLFLCIAEVISVSHLLVAYKNVKILPIISSIRFGLLFILTFLIIKGKNDTVYYVIYYSLTYFISNIIILIYTFYKYKLTFQIQIDFSRILIVLKEATPYFISRINLLLSDKLYNILSAIFISLFAVALLDISFKILSVIIIPIQILSVVILGRLSIRSSSGFIKQILLLITCFSLFLFITLYLFRYQILTYYSFSCSKEVIFPLVIILFSSLFANLSIFIGDNVMVVFSMEKKIILSSLYSSLIVFSILLFALCYWNINLIVFSFFFLSQKILELLFRLYYSWNYIK